MIQYDTRRPLVTATTQEDISNSWVSTEQQKRPPNSQRMTCHLITQSNGEDREKVRKRTRYRVAKRMGWLLLIQKRVPRLELSINQSLLISFFSLKLWRSHNSHQLLRPSGCPAYCLPSYWIEDGKRKGGQNWLHSNRTLCCNTCWWPRSHKGLSFWSQVLCLVS